MKGKIEEKREKRKWTERFFEIAPYVDEHGKEVEQNPPLNKMRFWEKNVERKE